jgi:hypothetical protein
MRGRVIKEGRVGVEDLVKNLLWRSSEIFHLGSAQSFSKKTGLEFFCSGPGREISGPVGKIETLQTGSYDI